MSLFILRSTCVFLVLGSVGILGCSGRNIHRDLTEDPRVLVRQWTLPTRTKPIDAGERLVEFSNPVLHQGTLVFGTQNSGLVALYPSTSQIRWTLPITHGVISELEIEGNAVFFGGGDGVLYSVHLDTGRVIWMYPLRNPIVSRPTVRNGRLFVTTSDDTVYSFDAGTGQWLWHYKRRTSAPATILGASSPLVDEEDVLVGLSDGYLICLSLQDGKLKWERRIHDGRNFTDVDAHPILDGGTLYVPSYDGSLYALNRRNGEPLWKFDGGGSRQVLIDGDRLIVPSTDGNIYNLQKQTGKVLWKFELDSGVPTRVLLADRYLVFGSSYRYLYAIDKTTGEGAYRYSAGRGSGFNGSPAYDSEHKNLYFLSNGGNLMSFHVQNPPKVFPHGSTSPYIFE